MKTSNRDLLVLLKDDSMTDRAIEQEVERLNELLFHVESADTFCRSNELFDLNKYKVFQEKTNLVRIMYQTELKPFIFILNKN